MKPRNDYQAALGLRLQGHTYGEIRKSLGIPKSTLSVWFKGLTLPGKTAALLESKQGNGLLALARVNKTRTSAIRQENEFLRKSYQAKIESLSERDLMVLGASLYWAEGYKNFNQKDGRYPYVSFSNADPRMIVVFMNFLEKVIGAKRETVKACVFVHPNIAASKAIVYWQDITGIPKKNFHFSSAISRASKNRRPKKLLPFGTLQVRVNRRQEFFKIRGLIDGIAHTKREYGPAKNIA